jgi:hypothetical protein
MEAKLTNQAFFVQDSEGYVYLTTSPLFSEMAKTCRDWKGGFGSAERHIVDAAGGLAEALKTGLIIKSHTTVPLSPRHAAPAQAILDAQLALLRQANSQLESISSRNGCIEMTFTTYLVVVPAPGVHPEAMHRAD